MQHVKLKITENYLMKSEWMNFLIWRKNPSKEIFFSLLNFLLLSLYFTLKRFSESTELRFLYNSDPLLATNSRELENWSSSCVVKLWASRISFLSSLMLNSVAVCYYFESQRRATLKRVREECNLNTQWNGNYAAKNIVDDAFNELELEAWHLLAINDNIFVFKICK